MIQVDNFSKVYNSAKAKFAVKNVSFTALHGEITGILGLNGAGKSTLIKAITADHYPSDGNIYVSPGNSLENSFETRANPVEIKKMIGYVPERIDLPGKFSVYETIKMTAALYGDLAVMQHIEKLISDFELEPLFPKKIKTISKGELQRLSFVLALVHNPPVLVLDEITSGLDVMQAHKVKKTILSLKKNKTILLSTHNMSEASELCSKICILIDGKLKCSGTTEEILLQTGTNNLEEAFVSFGEGKNEI